MIISLFLQYWVQLAICLSILGVGAAGLYGYKVYKEHKYKTETREQRDSYPDCVNQAIGYEAIQECFKKIK